jgi:hypothetical protein
MGVRKKLKSLIYNGLRKKRTMAGLLRFDPFGYLEERAWNSG